tara:strand:+ start:2516 stop:3448 length:933 start_codon:yes stop_codon:yes gene_type:complete
MIKALIGYSGLIGKNLSDQTYFKYKFNSKNIHKIKSKEYDLVVCAGAPGKMHLANKFPKNDKIKINKLIYNLKKVKTKKFVLISTIQVFKNLRAKNSETSKNFNKKITYGKNRRMLEIFCEKKFKNLTIIRLPSVFGKFLKKNFIHDLFNPMPMMLNHQRFLKTIKKIPYKYKNIFKNFYRKKDNNYFLKKIIKNKAYNNIIKILNQNNLSASSFTNPNSSFQYYFLKNLWNDISYLLNKDIKVINFSCQPLTAKNIYKKLKKKNMKSNNAIIYEANMVSKYSKYWNSRTNYLYNKKEIIKQLLNFYKYY